MYKYITIFMFAIVFILASSTAYAFDYNIWKPLLPESIQGMEKKGDTEGMNMEKGGQSWSSLRQKYSDADGNEARLSIVTGSDAPGIREFKAMQKFNMETEKKKVKTLDVSGYKSVLDFNKQGGQSNLVIGVQDETLVVIDTRSFDDENDIISLADDVPLSDIADSVE